MTIIAVLLAVLIAYNTNPKLGAVVGLLAGFMFGALSEFYKLRDAAWMFALAGCALGWFIGTMRKR